MYNDLNIFIDKNRINYTITELDDDIKITCNNINSSKIKIYYDNNVYKIILNKKIDTLSNTIDIDLTKEEQKEFFFTIELKDTYLVKIVYKYVNELIDKDMLIKEINLFKKYKDKYKDDLNELINKIDKCEEEIEELIINHQSGYRSEYTKIVNILTNNNTYKEIVDKMTNHDLMLLIT